MNMLRFTRTIRCLLTALGWTAVFGVASAAFAQVRPPDAADCDGNEYRYPVMTWDVPSVRVPSAKSTVETKPLPAIVRKLSAIIIPRFECLDMPLPNAVEQIRTECQRLDPDPSHRGFAFSLKAAVSSAVKITLKMERIPAWDALDYIAAEAGLRVQPEADTIVFVSPPDGYDHLPVAEFQVPAGVKVGPVCGPFVFTDPNTTLTVGREKQWLEAQGVLFPPGATATYLPAARKLIVRDTPENLELIAGQLAFPALTPIPP